MIQDNIIRIGSIRKTLRRKEEKTIKNLFRNMKIAIFSDSHDNLTNLNKAISLIKKEKIGILIHCGDVSSPETLKMILKKYSGKIYLVLGNMDSDYSLGEKINFLKKSSRIKAWKEFGEIEINRKKIAFSHFPKIAEGLAKSQKYDIVFYGHLHRPWQKKIGKTKLVNPGNLSGLLFKASFAVFNPKNEKLKLIILETID